MSEDLESELPADDDVIIWHLQDRNGHDAYRVTKGSTVLGEFTGRSVGFAGSIRPILWTDRRGFPSCPNRRNSHFGLVASCEMSPTTCHGDPPISCQPTTTPLGVAVAGVTTEFHASDSRGARQRRSRHTLGVRPDRVQLVNRHSPKGMGSRLRMALALRDGPPTGPRSARNP